MRIAFIGKAGSGKTSAALYLVAKHGFSKYSFADALKKEVMDKYKLQWNDVFVTKSEPIRAKLQELGMERRLINPTYWIDEVNNAINRHSKLIKDYIRAFSIEGDVKIEDELVQFVVIDDMRFTNEAQWAKANGFVIISLIRDSEYVASGMEGKNSEHVSEMEWMSIKPDIEIESNSLSDLFKKLDGVVFNLMLSNQIEDFKEQQKTDVDLIESYEKSTGKKAIWRGKETKGFLEWKILYE